MYYITVLTCLVALPFGVLCTRNIPEYMSLGVASAAYQTEGAWNYSNKGPSIWDNYAHGYNAIVDGSTGDVACDSYKQYERDIEMLKELGVDHYRFSISWPRILPNGFINETNPSGIEHYNKLINKLIENNIEPVVTIFHWDLPMSLVNRDGWKNPENIQYFVEYSDLVFQLYGDRVKYWITFNEPSVICITDHLTGLGILDNNIPGVSEYQCGHNILKAHAAVYHLYREKYKSMYKGKLSMALHGIWCEPASNSHEDKLSAERCLQFLFGWFAHPILSKEGDYPKLFKQTIDKRSKLQGDRQSRLPKFTKKEIAEIKGTVDYLGLNHYTTHYTSNGLHYDISNVSFAGDMGFNFKNDITWPKSAKDSQFTVPWGFTKLLHWIKDNYNNPEVFIMENGYPDRGGLDDDDKIYYIASYINALLDAIEDGCKVIGYTVWSLMDSFEWISGYTLKYGLYEVDYHDPHRNRTPKKSAFFYREVIKNKNIVWMIRSQS